MNVRGLKCWMLDQRSRRRSRVMPDDLELAAGQMHSVSKVVGSTLLSASSTLTLAGVSYLRRSHTAWATSLPSLQREWRRAVVKSAARVRSPAREIAAYIGCNDQQRAARPQRHAERHQQRAAKRGVGGRGPLLDTLTRPAVALGDIGQTRRGGWK